MALRKKPRKRRGSGRMLQLGNKVTQVFFTAEQFRLIDESRILDRRSFAGFVRHAAIKRAEHIRHVGPMGTGREVE